jgi:hypothetical protein
MRACKTFVVFPSAYPTRAAAAVEKWKAMGYQAGVYFNTGTQGDSGAYHEWRGPYEGYWNACNWMAKMLVNGQEQAQIVIFAADDIEPDPKKTCQEISNEFIEHFPDLFGVMQPCGDRQGMDRSGKPAAARICGSPWLGAEWIRRAYQGNGPVDSRFFHFYGDESLYEVAGKQNALWMRPDLMQYHRHWSWGHEPQQAYQRKNSNDHWLTDKALFELEKSKGFPGSEPLPI